jgi:hypothetical protein
MDVRPRWLQIGSAVWFCEDEIMVASRNCWP